MVLVYNEAGSGSNIRQYTFPVGDISVAPDAFGVRLNTGQFWPEGTPAILSNPQFTLPFRT
jgi:hypothetical protein